MLHPGADEGKPDIIPTTDHSDFVVTEIGLRPLAITDIVDPVRKNPKLEALIDFAYAELPRRVACGVYRY